MTDTLPAVTTLPTPSANLLFDQGSFGQLQRVANMFANSQLVPAHLRGKVADCSIALYMAHRLNEDPLTVMQNIVVVNGRAGWMTQYMIGRANKSGVFKGRINWRSEGKGEGLVVTAFATLADTDEEVTATVSMSMAKAEGWTKNPKYSTMPEHMLKWRSAAMLVRLYAPEVMLGIPAAEDIPIIDGDAVVLDAQPSNTTDAIKSKLKQSLAHALPAEPEPAAVEIEPDATSEPIVLPDEAEGIIFKQQAAAPKGRSKGIKDAVQDERDGIPPNSPFAI